MNEKLKAAREYEALRILTTDPSVRPLYHLTGASGWINDPNGFSVYKDEIHLFYQENPYSNSVGPIYWGHAKTKDFVRWERLPAALAPDREYDRNGCFSGGACELPDGRHMILYTGHAEDPDFPEGCRETQCAAFGDGRDYQKTDLNPVIGSSLIPVGGSKRDFRDPKLTLEGDKLRALVVNKDGSGSGAVLMYESADGLSWAYRGTLFRNLSRYGKMWECPDMFPLDGKDVLIASVQEMKDNVPGFREGFETLGIIGTYDDRAVLFHEESVNTLDYGPDFYAPTTVPLKDGRRIMTAWMQDWATSEDKAEGLDFCGQMILPRELSIEQGRLYQRPVREIEAYRGKSVICNGFAPQGKANLAGLSGRCLDLTASLKTAGAKQDAEHFVIHVAENDCHGTVIDAALSTGTLTVSLKNSGNPKSMTGVFRIPVRIHAGQLKLRLLLDRYSMELFINDGEQTATFLIYTPQEADGISFEADPGVTADLEGYQLIV